MLADASPPDTGACERKFRRALAGSRRDVLTNDAAALLDLLRFLTIQPCASSEPDALEEDMLIARSMPVRYFTPQEANELIPTIRAYLLKIREHGQSLRTLERTLDATSDPNERERLENERAGRELGQRHLLERIDQLGAELLDPLELGRVRFPAMRNGEPVWLLWHLGEPRVERWSPIGAHVMFGARLEKKDSGRVRWEWRN